jgi:hypothetical protein
VGWWEFKQCFEYFVKLDGASIESLRFLLGNALPLFNLKIYFLKGVEDNSVTRSNWDRFVQWFGPLQVEGLVNTPNPNGFSISEIIYHFVNPR